ncbi:MAG: hypothetical protein ACXABV_20220 [Candidatus Thorarchaeota archaeon]|jgi:hypothetical protein
MKNQLPFVLCLIGGLLLISVNYTHGVNSIAFIYIFLHGIAALVPYFLIIDAVLLVLWLIAWFGGAAVILGGYLLTTSYVRLGKFVIAISAGFGLISFILTVLWVVVVAGWTGLLVLSLLIANTGWAMGLILTIIARTIAH